MKEDILFGLYKDKPMVSAKHFRKEIKSKYKDININELFLRIANYQIDKYGETLGNDYEDDDIRIYKKTNAKNRKKSLNKYWREK